MADNCFHGDDDCDGESCPLCPGCQGDLESRRIAFEEYENELSFQDALVHALREGY